MVSEIDTYVYLKIDFFKWYLKLLLENFNVKIPQDLSIPHNFRHSSYFEHLAVELNIDQGHQVNWTVKVVVLLCVDSISIFRPLATC